MIQDYRRSRTRRNSPRGEITANLSKLQKTQLEPDKNDFDSLQYALNVIHKGANAQSRRGYDLQGTVDDLLGLNIHETETENYLYGIAKDGATDSKVVHINRSTGVTADVVDGITGQGSPDSTSLSNFFYVVNGGGGIRKCTHDGSTDTDMTISGETIKLITNDGARLWFVCDTGDGEILRFSQKYLTGDVVNLTTVSSTLLDRAGVAESNISKFTSLERSGDRIIATGENLTEVFKIPDFGGVTEFTADVPVRVAAFPNIGVKGRRAVITIGSYAYEKPEDGVLVRIGMVPGRYGYDQKEYQDNLLQMEGLNFDNAALGYDSRNNLLLISCRDGGNNDRVVAFNIFDETFSLFDNIFSTEWASDADNVYFWDDDKVYDAFKETTYTDAGLPINLEVITQMTDFGDPFNYKKLHGFYLDIEYNEDTTADVAIYADRGINGSFIENILRQIGLTRTAEVLGRYAQSFGRGVWGAAGVATNDNSNETLITQERISLQGQRFEMGVSLSVSTPISIRGLGLTSLPTQRQSKTINYK